MLRGAELYNKLIDLLNNNAELIKEDPDKFKKTQNILNMKSKNKRIFNTQSHYDKEAENNNLKQIENARAIGNNITMKTDKDSAAKNLYKELEQIEDFATLFTANSIKPRHIYRFGRYLSELRTNKELQDEHEEDWRQKFKQQTEEFDKTIKESSDKIEQLENEIKNTEDEARKRELELQRQNEIDKRKAIEEELRKYRHRRDERDKKREDYIIERFKKDFEEIYGFAPGTASFIKQKIKDQAYSLEKDQLINVINKAIENKQLPKDANPEKIARAIYVNGAKDVMKRINRISNLAIMTGYNHDLYNKLPGDVAEEVQRYITDKIQNDIRRKNIKYILPKDKPRWEYAMQSKQLNPMLGRSAWRVN